MSDVVMQNDDVVVESPEPEFFIRKAKSSKFIVEYHRDMCIGAAACAAIAPNTFLMDDENKAVFTVADEVDEDDAILAAAQSCPVFAIIVKDAETGEQVFPPM